MARIRKLRPDDLPAIFDLYRAQTASLTVPAKVRRAQFERDLFTARMKRNPEHHHPRARIALVAVDARNRVRAFVSGGMVLTGDEVLAPRTAYLQNIMADPSERPALDALLPRVVGHLRRFRPEDFLAFDGCLSPVFAGPETCCLPSAWSWIGQALIDYGFEVAGRSQHMACSLEKPRRREPKAPRDFMFDHPGHGLFGIGKRHDFACALLRKPCQYEDAVAWCGNFYSGAFITGSGFRSLHINWLTVMNDTDRGKGYGRLILRHSLHRAQVRGARAANLLTDVDNFIAQNLYCSEGFQTTDVVHAFRLNSKRKPAP